jgi:hypothetical protein
VSSRANDGSRAGLGSCRNNRRVRMSCRAVGAPNSRRSRGTPRTPSRGAQPLAPPRSGECTRGCSSSIDFRHGAASSVRPRLGVDHDSQDDRHVLRPHHVPA